MISGEERNAGERDLVEELLRAAGRRMEPPAAAYERTLAAATVVLQAKRRRKRLQFLLPAAFAAVAAGIAVLVLAPWKAMPPEVARVDRIAGSAELRASADEPWTAAGGAGAVMAGSMLRTAATGRVGLRLADGTSLRLGEAGEILIATSTRVILKSGRVYVDTGPPGRHAGPVEIVTSAGTAVDRGTQFEVRFRDRNYRLRVREGWVVVRSSAGAADNRAGDELVIDQTHSMHRARVARDDPDWQWAETVAPAPEIEGRPLAVLLAWVERETGHVIRYASAETEREAQRVILHGTVHNLEPMQVLAAMLATTDLRHRMVDGTILIEPKTSL